MLDWAAAEPEVTGKAPMETTLVVKPLSSAPWMVTWRVGVVPVTVDVLMYTVTSPGFAISTAVPLVVPAALRVAPVARLAARASRTSVPGILVHLPFSQRARRQGAPLRNGRRWPGRDRTPPDPCGQGLLPARRSPEPPSIRRGP